MDSLKWIDEMKQLDNDNENSYDVKYRIAKALEIIAEVLLTK